jgi:glycosyltransferase involved in cell wall biosynthesis
MVTRPDFKRRCSLHLCVPPNRSGLDSFGPKTASCISQVGIPTDFNLIWPQNIYRLFNSGCLPFGRRFFRNVVAPFYANRLLSRIQAGDVAWIQSFCVPTAELPEVEATLKGSSVSYIFHLMDNWFDVDWLRQGTIRRCLLANLVGVPTPQLAQRVREVVPEAKVEVFEEPIDLDRLEDKEKKHFTGEPVVLWCGNPYNLRAIQNSLGVLRRVRKHSPFVLRVVCGEKPSPEFSYGLDVEWKQFDHHSEGRLLAGSWFGLAPMENSAYNQCKGAYKVKTYLAAGLPVIASPVGFQSELVRGGHDVGLLPDTPTAWEEAVSMLITDPHRCAQMGINARNYALKRFSYDAVSLRWYNSLISHFPSLA